MKIKINRKTLLAMNMFTSKDPSRFVLHGIGIEVNKAGNCFVIGTDGRRLAAMNYGEVIERAENETLSAIVRVDVAMLKALPKSQIIADDVVMTFKDNTVTFEPFGKGKTTTRFESELIEGNYPRWRQVVPKGKQSSPLDPCFNWRLLEGFTKAAEMLVGSRDASIKLRQADALAPIIILIPSLPQFVGVLMPMRSDIADNQAPDWATEAEAAKPATPEAELTKVA